MKITADFTNITGKIKPMHGVGQPPLSLWRVTDTAYMHYLGEAGIPYSRLHDTGGRYGAGVYVDVPNLFRDFDADENLPESYDFSSTDILLNNLKKQGVEPFYRLGITIENDHAVRCYRNFPPKSPEKWARICEHIIRHYNEGWADGYRLGITYWEIWNEPDDCVPHKDAAMWQGSEEDYFTLYEAASKHLKACFGDTIKVGGYASCGFYSLENDPDGTGVPRPVTVMGEDGFRRIAEGAVRTDYFLEFFHHFLQHVKKTGAPLDFFSWHSYATPARTMQMAEYCRRVLTIEGFGDVEDVLNEWNTCHDDRRGTAYASSNVLAMMLGMQKQTTSVCTYYDASMGLMNYSGLFNGETHKPHLSYFTFLAFNRLYRMKNEVFTSSDEPDLWVGAAAPDAGSTLRPTLLVSNTSAKAVTVELSLTGVDPDNAEILVIDDTYAYSPSGKRIADGKLVLSPWSCYEIRF